MWAITYAAIFAVGALFLYPKLRSFSSLPEANFPYVRFDGNNSPARYNTESETILAKGYTQYSKRDMPFAMRNPNNPQRPLIMLPLKYLSEVKWVSEQRLSFWRHIDSQSILPQIDGPSINGEVTRAARDGLNRALVYLIEPLRKACVASYEKEMPSCPDWTSLLPYPLIVKVFANMSAYALVGPELGSLGSEWQTLSMSYVATALSAPSKVRDTYPRWLYWISRYTHDGIKAMWRHRVRARELLTPALQHRIDATEEVKSQGTKNPKGPRKYEDGIQWLLDAHIAHGKDLTPDQLVQELFVIIVASIHSTSSVGLCILFDMLEHPDTVSEIRKEIVRVRDSVPAGTWSRQKLAELRLLDSFMRESGRLNGLTQYTAVQRVAVTPRTFKDGLTIPAGTTMAFPNYHYGRDASFNPRPDAFDPERHLRKREEHINTHKFHFASVSEDSLNFGAGRHACPGRFFAQETLKLIIIHLLTHYEIKHAEEAKGVPRVLASNLFRSPNPALPILFKGYKKPL